MAARLFVYPAFYRRVRHYRDRIGVHDGRPQVAAKFVKTAEALVLVRASLGLIDAKKENETAATAERLTEACLARIEH